jgi:hypothetical protein
MYLYLQESPLPKQDSNGNNAVNHELLLTTECLTTVVLFLYSVYCSISSSVTKTAYDILPTIGQQGNRKKTEGMGRFYITDMIYICGDKIREQRVQSLFLKLT